jgi:hypothetical protein
VPKYEVYATRWNDPRVVEEMLPAKGLEFSMPLSKHGECSFSATVEPGRSFWRPSIAPVMSGLLVERDGVPVWCGWVIAEDEIGPRTFSFQAVEWGAIFQRVPAVTQAYTGWNDHDIFRDLITRAASATSGQDPKITMSATTGATTSDLTVNPWDDSTVEGLFTSLGESAGGPEWYFGAAGTHENPVRQLVLGDRLGQTTARTVLEFVEDTPEWAGYDAPPSITLLGNLFPAGIQWPLPGRRGGNVVAKKRTRNSGASSTQAIAVGSGEEKAQLRKTAQATRLLNAGWPRLTRTERYQDVTIPGTLQRHADGDLAATAGLSTGYSLVTLDGDPTADWTLTPRGSSVRVVLDTDVYGAERPVGGPDGFTTRLLNTTVRVADDGPAQIQWDTSEVLETL